MTGLVPPTPAGRWLVVICGAAAAGVGAAEATDIPGWIRLAAPTAPLPLLAAAAALRARMSVAATPQQLAGVGLVLLACALGLERGSRSVAAAAVTLTSPVTCRGTVSDLPQSRGAQVVVVAVAACAPRAGVHTIALQTVGGAAPPAMGDTVDVSASGLRPPGRRPGPLSAALLDRDGVDAVAVSARVIVFAHAPPGLGSARDGLRRAAIGALSSAMPGPDAALAGGIAAGVRTPLPGGLDDELRDSGLVHLVATSGLKVAIVAGACARVLGVLAVGPLRRRMVTLVAVALYIGLAGGGAAAARSAAMGAVGLVADWGIGGRRVETVPLLALTAAAMLLAEPALVADIGFQLSFFGTLGIVAFADRVAACLPGPQLLTEPFAVTVAAQVATLSVSAATFGSISLVGPLANALAIPLVPLLIGATGLGLGVGALVPPLGVVALLPATLLTRAIATIAHLAASLPLAAIHVASWSLAWTAVHACLLAVALGAVAVHQQRRRSTTAVDVADAVPHRRRRDGSSWRARRPVVVGAAGAVAIGGGVAAAVLGILAGRAPDGRLHVAVLDAGSGSAVVVRAPTGEVALVDGGSDPTRLLIALAAVLPVGTQTIDALVLTGAERAAVAGLTGLPGRYGIGVAVVPEADLGAAARSFLLGIRGAGTTIETVRRGQPWTWAGLAWRCLELPAPSSGPISPLCALQVGGGNGVLVLGEAAPDQQDVVAGQWGRSLATRVLVAPSSGSVTPALLAAARPAAVAFPGSQRSGAVRRVTAVPGVSVRAVASDGTLRWSVGPAGDVVEDR